VATVEGKLSGSGRVVAGVSDRIAMRSFVVIRDGAGIVRQRA
jgi:hypothetical protein